MVRLFRCKKCRRMLVVVSDNPNDEVCPFCERIIMELVR